MKSNAEAPDQGPNARIELPDQNQGKIRKSSRNTFEVMLQEMTETATFVMSK